MDKEIFSDILKKNESDLLSSLDSFRKDVDDLNLERLSGKLKDTSLIKKNRARIARYKTALNQVRREASE